VTVTVVPGKPHTPEATRLLEASHALMQSLFPAEANHYLSLDALAAPGIRFFLAKTAGETLGCGALALKGNYGEVKSLFVDPKARGLGVAEALMHRIETEARRNNLPFLRLETGNALTAAHRLYTRCGFVGRGPFGDYPEEPTSVFMEKPLT